MGSCLSASLLNIYPGKMAPQTERPAGLPTDKFSLRGQMLPWRQPLSILAIITYYRANHPRTRFSTNRLDARKGLGAW